ncbi:hypothetical protein H0E87_025171 [Populus deltoides]|uniref:Uncharacterized protein n=1 Tax=Populus deltoides TaxID=3696 RepID=A0A8T2X9Q0_POPDE|nr:hypothetical protein H0E87_025171 [Populus deltoides]
MHGNSLGSETSKGDGAETTGRCSRRKIRPAAHSKNRIAVMQESFRCGLLSSHSQVEESLLLAWQKIGALGVSVFCSFYTVLRPPLLFLHLLRNELLLAAERKGE